MWTLTKRCGGLALAGLAVFALAGPARAQFFRQPFMRQGTLPVYSTGVNPNSPFYNPINPLSRVAPGVTSQQALFNTFQPLYATARLPPWMFGYNPYPSPIIGGYGGAPYAPPAYNPYGGYGGGYNPYMGGYGGGGYGGGAPSPVATNPYLAASVASNPYTSALAATEGGYTNPYVPYSSDPTSGYLYGTASVMGASGKLMMDQERARIMREMWEQSRLDTKKKKLEYKRWEMEHRITLSEELKKQREDRLKYIREHASPGEVESGRAQNDLLSDLAKHPEKKSSLGDVPIDPEVLKHINITGRKGGNLGLLRNEGQLQWPAGLASLVPDQDRTEIDSLAKSLYEMSQTGTPKANLVGDLKARVDKLQEMLSKKLTELPSGQFLAARRFLNELQSAVHGLAVPDLGRKYAAWLREGSKGMTTKEVADWLNRQGLQIAPAMTGDEDAYQVLHQALANYDIAVGSAVASNRSE
jgi:hypothetical protein